MLPKLRTRTIIAGVIVAALAVVAIAYALNQVIRDAPTGLFQVETTEQADIAVTTYGLAADSGPVADGSWCASADLTTGPVRCVVDATNLTQTKAVAVSLAVTDIDVADGLGLADALTLQIFQKPGADAAARNDCRSGALTGFTSLFSGVLADAPVVDVGNLDAFGTSPYARRDQPQLVRGSGHRYPSQGPAGHRGGWAR